MKTLLCTTSFPAEPNFYGRSNLNNKKKSFFFNPKDLMSPHMCFVSSTIEVMDKYLNRGEFVRKLQLHNFTLSENCIFLTTRQFAVEYIYVS